MIDSQIRLKSPAVTSTINDMVNTATDFYLLLYVLSLHDEDVLIDHFNHTFNVSAGTVMNILKYLTGIK